MLIACPACAATYQVPDHLIGAGRQMRCAKCAHEWWFEPEAAPAEEPAAESQTTPPAPPEPEAPPPLAAEPDARPTPSAEPAPGPGLALPLAWAGSVLLVLGGVAGLFVFHAPLAEAWPPLARLYGWFGV